MYWIHAVEHHQGSARLTFSGFVRPLLLVGALLLGTVRCTDGSVTGPVSPETPNDPASASIAPGETLAIVRWNSVIQTLTGRNHPSQNAAWRIMAYATLAQYASVELTGHTPGVTRASMRGTVAGSTAAVLAYAFPADTAAIETFVRDDEASLPEGQRRAFQTAVSISRLIGARIVSHARADRFDAVFTDRVPVGPGLWSSLAKPPAPPLLPMQGEMVPFFLTSGRQFRPAAPPAFDSPVFRSALAEVRQFADSRTAQQDSLAKFWAIPTGGLVVGYWNTAALDLVSKAHFGERAAAHVLALMNSAGFDALTACHDAKYTYWLIRPSGADTAIRTSVGVPNHPSYPSNHACISGASANVLSAFFPSSREQLQATATEASLSRLYGGIHYRFDTEAGLEIARQVATLAVSSDRRGRLLQLTDEH